MERLLAPLQRFDDGLAIWGVAMGALSIVIYRTLSPQRRLGELAARGRTARVAPSRYNSDVFGAWPLMPASLALSFKHLGLTTWPAPMVLVLHCMAGAYSGVTGLSCGPAWLHGWATPFFGSMVASSVALEFVCRIH